MRHRNGPRKLNRTSERRAVLTKLFGELGPRYPARLGGYTRMLKIGCRVGNNVPTADVELVDRPGTASAAPAEVRAE